MAGARLNFIAFGRPEGEVNQDILLYVFLRGGYDGLNLMMPIAGTDRAYYEAARPSIKVPANEALMLNSQFGLHPSFAPIYELFQANHVAFIHAAGLTTDTRSHFDAQQFIELGTPGSKATTTGWLTRHLQSAPNLPEGVLMPSLAASDLTPISLQGDFGAAVINSVSNFSYNRGPSTWRNAQRVALRAMYTGNSWLHHAGIQTLDTLDIVEAADPGNYEPANGAVYPGGNFGNQLKIIAQMIKLQMGLRVAAIDLGGWDTHDSQGDGSGGYFSSLLSELATGLNAFYIDMDGAGNQNYTQRLTIVVMSEFGRRLRENANRGTDHGHGSLMFALGGNVNGGVYGDWPGLRNDQLYDGADLAVTTDYRRILSEILIRRLGNPYLGTVFPGYTGYAPLDIVQGEDLPPIVPTPTPTPPPPAQTQNAYLPFVQR